MQKRGEGGKNRPRDAGGVREREHWLRPVSAAHALRPREARGFRPRPNYNALRNGLLRARARVSGLRGHHGGKLPNAKRSERSFALRRIYRAGGGTLYRPEHLSAPRRYSRYAHAGTHRRRPLERFQGRNTPDGRSTPNRPEARHEGRRRAGASTASHRARLRASEVRRGRRIRRRNRTRRPRVSNRPRSGIRR